MTTSAVVFSWEEDPTMPDRFDPLSVLDAAPRLHDSGEATRYLETDYPSELDHKVERLVDAFARSGPQTRARLRSAPIGLNQLWLLLRYAERMAGLALCRGDEAFITAGLVVIDLIGERARASSLMPVRLQLVRAARLLEPG